MRKLLVATLLGTLGVPAAGDAASPGVSPSFVGSGGGDAGGTMARTGSNFLWRDSGGESPIVLAKGKEGGEGGEGGRGKHYQRRRVIVIDERDYYPELVAALLGGTVVRVLDARDRWYIAEAFERADAAPGYSTPWLNPESGRSGAVTVRPGLRGGQPCREYRSTVRIGGRLQEAFGVACREPDGSWQIIE